MSVTDTVRGALARAERAVALGSTTAFGVLSVRLVDAGAIPLDAAIVDDSLAAGIGVGIQSIMWPLEAIFDSLLLSGLLLTAVWLWRRSWIDPARWADRSDAPDESDGATVDPSPTPALNPAATDGGEEVEA